DRLSTHLERDREIRDGQAALRVAQPFAVQLHAALLDLPRGLTGRGGEACINDDTRQRPHGLSAEIHLDHLQIAWQLTPRVYSLKLGRREIRRAGIMELGDDAPGKIAFCA